MGLCFAASPSACTCGMRGSTIWWQATTVSPLAPLRTCHSLVNTGGTAHVRTYLQILGPDIPLANTRRQKRRITVCSCKSLVEKWVCSGCRHNALEAFTQRKQMGSDELTLATWGHILLLLIVPWVRLTHATCRVASTQNHQREHVAGPTVFSKPRNSFIFVHSSPKINTSWSPLWVRAEGSGPFGGREEERGGGKRARRRWRRREEEEEEEEKGGGKRRRRRALGRLRRSGARLLLRPASGPRPLSAAMAERRAFAQKISR